MRKDKPSRTALKLALNIVTLGSKPGMEAILPGGIVDATRKLLVASGAAGERTVKWAVNKPLCLKSKKTANSKFFTDLQKFSSCCCMTG